VGTGEEDDSVAGKSRRKAPPIKGAVMRKMTNKTSMTSTKGVTLISLMGDLTALDSNSPIRIG
jgi:hypothetical protein